MQRIADFRAALRAFERRSERISRRCGLTPQRYLLLLMLKGAADGSERLTFSELAERLQLGRSAVTELVARAEEAGLLRRARSESDRRAVYLSLTGEGDLRLRRALTASDESRRELTKAFTRLKATFREASSAAGRGPRA